MMDKNQILDVKLTNKETLEHIRNVVRFLSLIQVEISKRIIKHDDTKLVSPELEIFIEYTSKLKASTYGSEEYKVYLKEMKVALDHHYESHRHHPEHFENGINDMNLIDLIEMLFDWKAAAMRHDDGDIFKSIEINKKRFNYNEQVAQIFRNTITYVEQNY